MARPRQLVVYVKSGLDGYSCSPGPVDSSKMNQARDANKPSLTSRVFGRTDHPRFVNDDQTNAQPFTHPEENREC